MTNFKRGQKYNINGVKFIANYKKKWKYQLLEEFVFHIPDEFNGLYKTIKESQPVYLSGKLDGDEQLLKELVVLKSQGILKLKKGYNWNGASGPTRDDETNLRGSAIHDALYQLMHYKLIPRTYKNRSLTDELFYQILLKDDMNLWRAKMYWVGVRSCGWVFC